MERRKEAQVFKGDVSPTAPCGRQRRSRPGTRSSSRVSLFLVRGSRHPGLGRRGKNLPWTSLRTEKLMSFKVDVWAGNHLWRLWAKGELSASLLCLQFYFITLEKLSTRVYVQITLDFLRIKCLWSSGQLSLKKYAKQVHLAAYANLRPCQ